MIEKCRVRTPAKRGEDLLNNKKCKKLYYMAFSSVTGNSILSRFLEAWPVASLRRMSIEQYANLEDHNAYCYWLEYGSVDLGAIGGMPLTPLSGGCECLNKKVLLSRHLSCNV